MKKLYLLGINPEDSLNGKFGTGVYVMNGVEVFKEFIRWGLSVEDITNENTLDILNDVLEYRCLDVLEYMFSSLDVKPSMFGKDAIRFMANMKWYEGIRMFMKYGTMLHEIHENLTVNQYECLQKIP